MLTSCTALEQKYGALFEERLPHRIPASEPAPRQRPGTTNLRSSAFICGSFFGETDKIRIAEESLKAAGVKEDSQES